MTKKRAEQITFNGDNTKPISIGFEDIDNAIKYYFDNVIQPFVIQNGQRIPVPVIYGSQERWKSYQKDGYYRDQNGKIMLPIIMFKKENIEKLRNITSKIDANLPYNMIVTGKKYSQKNSYSKFNLLNNVIPQETFYATVVPDYVEITYKCVIQTYYAEQLNKLIEAINYTSDAYWGDPERFKFKASINNFSSTIEMNTGEERIAKSEFTLKIFGYIVPDIIQKDTTAIKKYNNKTKTIITVESTNNLNNEERKPPQIIKPSLGKTPIIPSSFDVGLVDRFGNDLGTKQVSANTTWDLRTLTPFDWADMFLSRETSWGVSGFYTDTDAENAVINLVDDLFSAGLWELMYGVYPLVGGTSSKHKWNLRYPFDNDNSLRLNFTNSPTHDWEGIKSIVNTFCCTLTDNPSNLGVNGFGHFSAYYRTYIAQNNNIDLRAVGDSRSIYWHLNDPNAGSGTLRMAWCGPAYQVNPSTALTLTGHWTLNRPSTTNIRQIRNGVLERDVSGNNSTNPLFDGVNVYQNFKWGGGNKTMSGFTLGKGLTSTQEADLYTTIQAFQTTLARQL